MREGLLGENHWFCSLSLSIVGSSMASENCRVLGGLLLGSTCVHTGQAIPHLHVSASLICKDAWEGIV